MNTYPVNERFHTWQGEGVHAGRAAFFIRLHGCPLHCPWCDSAGTWHKDFIPQDVARMSAVVLAAEAKESGAHVCVVTGGEPCIHNLDELTVELRKQGLHPHLETSGAFDVSGAWDWVTVSPKDMTVEGKPMRSSFYFIADEFKIIVDDPNVPQKWLARIQESPTLQCSRAVAMGNVWLHPEWSRHEDPIILSAISEAVKAHPLIFRAGWQLHKNYKVDAADQRSRPPVPLGGNPAKGF